MTKLVEYLRSLEILDLITHEKAETDAESVQLFKPDFTKKTIYNSLLPTDRQQLHLQVGQVLERIYATSLTATDSKRNEADLLLAHHFEQGGDVKQAKKYLKKATAQATALYAHQEAKTLYDQIISLLGETDHYNQWHMVTAREQVVDQLGDRESQAHSLTAMQMLAELMGNYTLLAITYQRWTGYFDKINQYRLMMEVAELGLTAANKVNDKLLIAQSLNLLAQAAWHQFDYQKVKNYAQQALETLHFYHSLPTQVDSFLHFSKANYALGQYDVALEYAQAAQELAALSHSPHQQAHSHFTLGWIYQGLGDGEQAEQQFQQALKKWQAIGYRYGEALTLSHLGWVACDQQNYTVGANYCQQALELSQTVSDRENEAYALNGLGLSYEHSGQWDSAQASYLLALALHREIGATTLAIFDQVSLARAAVGRQNFKVALSYLKDITELISNGKVQQFWNPWPVYLSVYQILTAIGETEVAKLVLNEAHTAIQQRANEISNPQLRHSFLFNVKVHREIETAWAGNRN